MNREIIFTDVQDNVIVSIIKASDQYLSVLTSKVTDPSASFITEIKDANAANLKLTGVTQESHTYKDALIMHTAITKAIIQNGIQPVSLEQISAHKSLYILIKLIQSGVHPSENSFKSAFTTRYLEDALGYQTQKKDTPEPSKYRKFFLSILISIFSVTLLLDFI